MKAFNIREKDHFNTLKKYGIDPMVSPSSDTEEGESPTACVIDTCDVLLLHRSMIS
jgi:hypothetical protein